MLGTTLGSYRIESELGAGGMGRVYLAEVAGKAPGLDAGARVALKVIHPHLLDVPGFFKRFLREAEIGKAVEQANVVRCYDCDALRVGGEQQHFLVMEYVEGQTLRDLLDELGTVPEELCRHIGREVAKGLAAIHAAGAVHRDLKPENVLITRDHVVKVMDLGIARLQDEAIRLSQTGVFVGSVEYAAPEQIQGVGDIDGRADLHALGLVLYELATGRHPYREDDVIRVLRRILEDEPRGVGTLDPQLTPFFEEVVGTLLAKERDDRFDSASALLAVLEDGEESAWWQARGAALRAETKRPLRRIRIPRETALYGRDDDLARLRSAYESARAGEGRVLLIEGEAGIGKTRLVDEFVTRLATEGEDLDFLFGSYPPGGAATAAGAFSTAYREHFGAEGSSRWLTEAPLLVPAFDALLRGEPPPKGEEPLTKESMQTSFVHATRALAAERPTIVSIEDLHFSPQEGLALFASLALAVPGHRILLVGTMRPGVSEQWTAGVARYEHVEHRMLSRLGSKDLAGLLEDAFRSRRLAEELALKIGEKSDGNPFFTFEIIRGLREGQFLSQRPDGTWVTTRIIEDIEVPSSVLDLVNARVADLEVEDKNLLDVASCCGFDFDPGVVAAALGMAELPALQRLARIEKGHRLVRSAGERVAFDHHQVQEALYGGLPQPLKRAYHAAVADAMATHARADEREVADLDGALCVDLAEHYLKGGRGEAALRYLAAALTHLEQGYQNIQAAELAQRALAVPGLLEGQGRVDVLLRRSERLYIAGRREPQREAAEAALALAREVGYELGETKGRAHLGNFYLITGRYEEALEQFEHHLACARAYGIRMHEGMATGNLGSTMLQLGRYAEAEGYLLRCRAIARELRNTWSESSAVVNLGELYVDLGRFEEALELHEEGLRLTLDSGDRHRESGAIYDLARALGCLGRFEEGLRRYQEALDLMRQVGARAHEATLRVGFGFFNRALGRPDEAIEHLERSLALSRETRNLRQEAYALLGLAVVAGEQGEEALAEERFEEALRIRRGLEHWTGEAEARFFRGDMRGRMGRIEAAREDFEVALRISREWDLAEGQYISAIKLARYTGESVDAALEALAAYESRSDAQGRLEGRYDLWVATGDRAHLEEAKRLADDLLRHAPEACRESMRTGFRPLREILEAWAEHGGEA